MTHRQHILVILKNGPMSCTQIADEMLSNELFATRGNWSRVKRNLTSTLSGTLNRMVVRGELEYAGTTARKGAMYKLNKI